MAAAIAFWRTERSSRTNTGHGTDSKMLIKKSHDKQKVFFIVIIFAFPQDGAICRAFSSGRRRMCESFDEVGASSTLSAFKEVIFHFDFSVSISNRFHHVPGILFLFGPNHSSILYFFLFPSTPS